MKLLQESIDIIPDVWFFGQDQRLDLGHDGVPGHITGLVQLQRFQEVNIELRVRV